jgi:hypothetical protein
VIIPDEDGKMPGGLSGRMTLIRDFRTELDRQEILSVDRFLEREVNKRFEKVGVSCIANLITSFQDDAYDNRLYTKPSGGGRANWIRDLLIMLDPDHSPKQFKKNKLKIITFNYDVSLEFYLTTRLASRWGMKDIDVWRDYVKPTLKPIHVYGQISWEKGQLHFGPKYDTDCRPVEVIYQAREDSPVFDDIEERLRESKVIGFFGFGFDDTNMRRLRLFGQCPPFFPVKNITTVGSYFRNQPQWLNCVNAWSKHLDFFTTLGQMASS